MLAVWQAADDIEVFESGWTFDHFYPIFSDSSGPCLEGWTTLTALAQATKRLRRRRARHRHPLPASRGAGQHGFGARHHLQRPPRARDRRRLERGGVRRLRHRTRHASRSASTASRRRCEVLDRSAEPGDDDASTASTTSSRTPATSRRARSSRTRRSASAAAARSARCASPPGTPSTGTSSAVRPRSSRASATCSPRTARTSAATRGRSVCRRMSGSAPTGLPTGGRRGGRARRGRPRSRDRLPAAAARPAVLEPLAEAIRIQACSPQIMNVTII